MYHAGRAFDSLISGIKVQKDDIAKGKFTQRLTDIGKRCFWIIPYTMFNNQAGKDIAEAMLKYNLATFKQF